MPSTEFRHLRGTKNFIVGCESVRLRMQPYQRIGHKDAVRFPVFLSSSFYTSVWSSWFHTLLVSQSRSLRVSERNQNSAAYMQCCRYTGTVHVQSTLYIISSGKRGYRRRWALSGFRRAFITLDASTRIWWQHISEIISLAFLVLSSKTFKSCNNFPFVTVLPLTIPDRRDSSGICRSRPTMSRCFRCQFSW